MNDVSGEHPSLDSLAAHAAGELIDAAVVTHVSQCGLCASEVAGLQALRNRLVAESYLAMPAAVAAALDAALAELPQSRSRRTPRWLAPVGLAAAAVAVLSLVAVPALRRGDSASDRGTVRLASGHDYQRGEIRGLIPGLLDGNAPGDRNAKGGAETAADSAAGTATTGRTAERAPAPPAAAAQLFATTETDISALRDDPARLRACLDALDERHPGLDPLVLDFARFEGAPALLVVLPSFTAEGEQVEDRVDVFVVGAGCGTEDAQVLDFQRVKLEE